LQFDPFTDIRIVETQPEYFERLAHLQTILFGGLTAEELFTVAMYQQQVRAFAEGQLTALVRVHGEWVVAGATTTLRTNHFFDSDASLYYFDFIGRGSLSTHEADGSWLYGIDLGVHPDFRRMGIGSRLYAVRHALVQKLGMCGELVAGLLPGYDTYRQRYSVAQYAARVADGELIDPTLTMQLSNGFHLHKLLQGYVVDARSDDTATLLIRRNPERLDDENACRL